MLGFDKSIVLLADRPRFTRAMTQMLRRLALFLLGRSQNLHRTAGLFDRRDRGFRGAMHLDGELRGGDARACSVRIVKSCFNVLVAQ